MAKKAPEDRAPKTNYDEAIKLRNGMHGECNMVLSRAYMKVASDEGYHPAMFEHAHALTQGGFGIDYDPDEAIQILKKIVDVGDNNKRLRAAVKLSQMFSCEPNILDEAKGVKYFELARELGYKPTFS